MTSSLSSCGTSPLREHFAAAEGGSRMLPNVAFVGAAAVGAFMMLTPGPEVASAIVAEEQEVSAAAAAAMRILPEAFLLAAANSAILLMLGSRIMPLGWKARCSRSIGGGGN